MSYLNYYKYITNIVLVNTFFEIFCRIFTYRRSTGHIPLSNKKLPRTVKIFVPPIRPPSCMTSKAYHDAPSIGILLQNQREADQFQQNKLLVRSAFPKLIVG